jgi:hypothetical protein
LGSSRLRRFLRRCYSRNQVHATHIRMTLFSLKEPIRRSLLDLSEAVMARSARPLKLPEADLNSQAPVASQGRQLGKRLDVEVGGA